MSHVLILQSMRQPHDGGEDHGGSADYGGADQHGFGRGFERVARAIVLFQVVLGLFELRREAEVLLDIGGDAGGRLHHGEFVNGLGVVGDRTVAIDGDRHRPHAEEAECHQTESENRGREHHRGREAQADVIARCPSATASQMPSQ